MDVGDRDQYLGIPTGCVSEITMRIRDEGEMVPDIPESHLVEDESQDNDA